jgi:hypothetical protein
MTETSVLQPGQLLAEGIREPDRPTRWARLKKG